MVIIYGFLSLIDYIIYSLAASMFRLIIDIAGVEYFDESQITSIANRIYIVIGVLMLFKLVISAVQYMINPDVFDDKDKGISGILIRIVISLGLIVVMPAVFRFAISIQKPVVESIPNIIFGTENRTDFKDDSVGMNISFQVLSAFVQTREGHERSIAETEKIKDLQTFQKNIMAGCPGVSLFGIFGDYDSCHYNYIIIVSTAAGVFLCYVLFVMTLDIAIRTIKFGVIRILAPIPISGYVFNKDKLNKFTKTAVTVYLDLFIRMAVIYFIIFAIRAVMESGIIKTLSEGDVFRGILVNVILILGLLMFAKNAPKFITELLGIQDVTSNDMKDMFTRAGGMLGATLGAGKSFISARGNARNEAIGEYKKKYGVNDDDWNSLSRKSKKQAIKDAVKDYNKSQNANSKFKFGHGVYGRAFRSSGAALGKGTYDSYWKGKGLKDTFSDSDRAGQKSYDLDKALVDNGINRGDYRREVINRRLGINSDLDVMNAEIEAAKNASDKSKAALDYVHGNIAEKFGAVKFTDAMIRDASFMKKIQITAGVNTYSFGDDGSGSSLINVDLTSMGETGSNTIAGVMNDLKTVIENQNGKFSGNDRAMASRMLDKLQGEADKYIINATKSYVDDPSLFTSQYEKLGFDENANPAFMRLVQEALEADIIHVGDTKYGREVWKLAGPKTPDNPDGKDLLYTDPKDGKVKVKPDKIGEWLALNKGMGQKAQTENIAAKGTQAANATVKSIADKYDKK